MEARRIEEILRATGGQLVSGSPSATVTGISTDSRCIQPGDLFFAIKGPRFDGHDFVPAALAGGAAGAVVSREGFAAVASQGRPIIKVADTVRALQDWAGAHRRRFSLPVVAVTGSSGKTTTKDMAAAALGGRELVLASQGNHNNEIGLPLALLALKSCYRAAVVEMGMRGLGQIRELAAVARPDAGVITNIGLTHVELLGSRENIARAKGELLESLPPAGLAVLNADDPWCRALAARSPAPVVFYGFGPEAEVRALDFAIVSDRGTSFRVNAMGSEAEIFIPYLGRHNVANALAAVAVALKLGEDLARIRECLAAMPPGQMRLERQPGPYGSILLNDAYNANPDSVAAALEVLRQLPAGRRIAVLGDMLELGPYAETAHRETGKKAAEIGADLLIGVGQMAAYLVAGARQAGLSAEAARAFGDREEAAGWLAPRLAAGDVVLVKGSRGMEMEKLVEQLQAGRAR
ncbi:MAG: UDP-N-acetylmuramoyl-tripeptide--D-alanyl-D-alanine ligase [Clostridia bacterium]|nr:MAG: UDP-N-acetylmuramoyl-tripeptide--D-alanyl-D-alanine ligase [Clostridia bacterium]